MTHDEHSRLRACPSHITSLPIPFPYYFPLPLVMPLLLLLILTEHRPTYTGVLGAFPPDIPLPPTPPADEAPNSGQGGGSLPMMPDWSTKPWNIFNNTGTDPDHNNEMENQPMVEIAAYEASRAAITCSYFGHQAVLQLIINGPSRFLCCQRWFQGLVTTSKNFCSSGLRWTRRCKQCT